MESVTGMSPRQLARIAGALYLINILGGAFAISVVPGLLVVQGDAAATAANIQAHEPAIWPIIWGFTEELVYLGYLLPRLQAWTGKTVLSVMIVVAMWGLQHSVIPFIGDQRYQASRVLGALIVVGGMTAIFMLGRRRLISAMIVHYVADFGAAISALALPRR